MSEEWIGVIHTTRPRYTKGASDLTLRSRLLLQLMRRKGRIELNVSGDECKWQVEFDQPAVQSYADGGVIDFSNHDAFRQLTIDWRGYVATDTLTKKQNAMNAGPEQLINLFQTKNNRLEKSVRDNFCGELYKDGEAAGRENNVHGLETFMSSPTAGVAADLVAQNLATYGTGSLSTAQGNQGGSWSTDLTTYPNAGLATDWPNGSGDASYDFLSPKLVNWSSTSWGTGGATDWESNAWRSIGQTITWLTVTGGKDGMPDICVMGADMFQGYKNAHESTRRITVPHKESEDLGFKNVLNQDGVAIQADFDCPAGVAYMLNLDKITLSSIMPELFWMEGPDKDPRTLWSWLWGVGFFGNAKYEPKHTAKIFAYA